MSPLAYSPWAVPIGLSPNIGCPPWPIPYYLTHQLEPGNPAQRIIRRFIEIELRGALQLLHSIEFPISYLPMDEGRSDLVRDTGLDIKISEKDVIVAEDWDKARRSCMTSTRRSCVTNTALQAALSSTCPVTEHLPCDKALALPTHSPTCSDVLILLRCLVALARLPARSAATQALGRPRSCKLS
jgi:hypothetical protein